MSNKKSGREIPEGDDFLDVIDFYTKVWGLKPQEAVAQAQEDYARGPNSPIYKNRLQQAQDWKAREEDYQVKQAMKPPITSSMPLTNPPQYVEPNPESAMADPRLVDPKAFAAQQALNARRTALAGPPQPESGPSEIQSGPNPESAMADPAQVDPAAMYAQAALNLRRQQLGQAAPISPMPIRAAAPTPAHLEDANLSSWQSLAGLLGYSPRR